VPGQAARPGAPQASRLPRGVPPIPERHVHRYGAPRRERRRGRSARLGAQAQGWQTDPNAYIYFTIQEQNWERTCEAIGRPEWIDDPEYNTAKARESHIFKIFDDIEKWLADKTKYEAVDLLRKFEVPCAPVLSMREIAYDPALRASRSVVEVEHKERGTYLTFGCPVTFSDFTPEITGSLLLGEHSDDVLAELGYDPDAIAKMHADHIV
jgi:formyl-CoA transferase